MKLFNIIEIKLLTKNYYIKQSLEEHGLIQATKVCMDLHGWSLSKSIKHVKKIRGF